MWLIGTEVRPFRPELVADLLPGATGSEPHNMKWVNERWGVFAAKDAAGNTCLCKIQLAGSHYEIEPVELTYLEQPGATP